MNSFTLSLLSGCCISISERIKKAVENQNVCESCCILRSDTLNKLKLSLLYPNISGLQYANMSSQTVTTVSSSSLSSESMQEWESAFSYEAAMEALSSLITRKKRGTKSNTDAKYTKLERMSMYIQVILILNIRGCNFDRVTYIWLLNFNCVIATKWSYQNNLA